MSNYEKAVEHIDQAQTALSMASQQFYGAKVFLNKSAHHIAQLKQENVSLKSEVEALKRQLGEYKP